MPLSDKQEQMCSESQWNFSDLTALFLNCTLKKSPEVSNTDALIKVVADLMTAMDVECETVRLADYNIAYGTESDMGDGDEWPTIYEKIKAADILVPSMPIWMGVRSSPCQLMCERLDGCYRDMNDETGQYPLGCQAAPSHGSQKELESASAAARRLRRS